MNDDTILGVPNILLGNPSTMLGNPSKMYFRKQGETVWHETPVKIVNVNCTSPEEPQTKWTNGPATATLTFRVPKIDVRHLRRTLFHNFRVPRKIKKAIKKQNPHIRFTKELMYNVAMAYKQRHDKKEPFL